MATNPAVPYWDEGNTFTGHASADVLGKRFVHVSGARADGNPRVAHAVGAAGKRVVGVTGFDAKSGQKVTVYSSPGIVMPVVAAEAITAGDLLYSDAAGEAVSTPPAGALPAAIALDDADDGDDVPAKLL